jgi:hypothetical protein
VKGHKTHRLRISKAVPRFLFAGSRTVFANISTTGSISTSPQHFKLTMQVISRSFRESNLRSFNCCKFSSPSKSRSMKNRKPLQTTVHTRRPKANTSMSRSSEKGAGPLYSGATHTGVYPSRSSTGSKSSSVGKLIVEELKSPSLAIYPRSACGNTRTFSDLI